MAAEGRCGGEEGRGEEWRGKERRGEERRGEIGGSSD